MKKSGLKKFFCVLFAAVLLIASMPITAFAASYPLITVVSSESSKTIMKGDTGALKFIILPEYHNEKYHVYLYNSSGVMVGSAEDSYYNTDGTTVRYITINIDTEALDLAVGTYTAKYWLSFYSLYQWNDAPNVYSYTFDVTPYVCSGQHVYDNDCDTMCNACGNSRTVTHAYSGNCDAACNVCGATRTTSVDHTYSSATDTICDVCSYTRVIIEEDNSTVIESGTCGANLTWKLTEKGTLTISGTGNMYSYDVLSNTAPWYGYEYRYIKTIVIEPGVTSIGNDAFYGCTAEKVSIPSTVTKIGEDSFGSTSLRQVVLPDGIKTIPKYAFSRCKLLESIIIPSSVQSFQQGCFDDCSSLQYFIIPDGVKEISHSMFWNCSSLEYVQIPSSVTSIDSFAFHECGNLSDIYFTGTQSQYQAIEIEFLETYNEGLLNATVHYNSKAPCTICQYSAWSQVDDNTHERVCVKCGEKETASHNWDAGVVTKQPSAEETGVKTYTCEGCSCTKTEILPKQETIPGDASGDGKINGKDYALLLQSINGWSVTIDKQAADVTGDGKVNGKDYALLLQYINGWNVELK